MTFLIDALATARLARLLTRDSLTRPTRDAISRAVDDGKVGSWAEELSRCQWCVSIWAAVAVLLVRRAPRARAVLTVLACSEFAGLRSEVHSEPHGATFDRDELGLLIDAVKTARWDAQRGGYARLYGKLSRG